jgi:hypothetical protein
MRKHFVIAGLALALGACSEATLPTKEWVDARVTVEGMLAVTNRGDAPVYIQVADPTELIQLTGCTPSTCTRIAPGATVEIPFSQITAYDPGDQQAAVNWWVFQDDGSPVTTGTIVVPL